MLEDNLRTPLCYMTTVFKNVPLCACSVEGGKEEIMIQKHANIESSH